MPIKKILTVILLFALPLLAHAEAWKYELKDALVTTERDGKKTSAVNMEVVDYYINRISQHAQSYPARFSDDQQRQDITQRLTQLIGFLEILGDESRQKDPRYLSRAAFANAMGYNLDIPGSGEKARQLYLKFLEIEPNSKQGNYFFGLFLAGTKKHHFESLPYLEKALSLGMEDARYTLGLLYVEQGKTEEGLRNLEAYSKANPNNENAKRVIQAVKDKTLNFSSKD